MSTVFATSSSGANTGPPVPDSSLRIQTSVEGTARSIVYGLTRVAGNLIWYGDFYALSVAANTGQQGGKGGGLFGAPSAPNNTTFNYFTSVEVSLGEAVVGIGPLMWATKSRTTLAESNMGAFLGSAGQLPWSYLSAKHPDQAFAYRLTAYVAGNIALGASAELPNWTFETRGAFAYSANLALPDADATLVVADYLTNANYGVPGWSATFNGDWTNAQAYTVASNLLISYALTSQSSASSFLQELLESLNVMPVWSEATLKLVPRGDQQIANNGKAYFPPTQPIYDLDDTDFLPNQASFGGTNADPVSAQQTPARKQDNIVKVQYLDRTIDYNPASLSAGDDGAILQYGERCSDGVKNWHWFQEAFSAAQAAQLGLGRKQIANKYAFTLRPRFILLDPGDIVTITDQGLGLFRQWVRITNITENQDRTLNFQTEEYLQGSASAPQYGKQVSSGSRPDYNADPGDINAPILFEPTDELAGGLEVWAAVSGVDLTLYGGCDAYISYDGATYARVPGGRMFGSSRMGVTTIALPSVPVNKVSQTIDGLHTLQVDLSESGGVLASGTQADALALNTSCWVGGEVIAYETADLAGVDIYNLNYLVRGAYGTEDDIVTHPVGTKFARLDAGIMRVPYEQTRIGSTLSLKFLPFNIWGVTPRSLADVPVYTYKLTGLALSSPLPPVTQVRTVYKDRFTEIWWQEITDFRQGIRYIVRKGDTFEGGQDLGTLAHPPLVAFGAGTFWIMPTCQPLAGLNVFGENAVSITIQGNMLTANIIQTTDYQATGWPGTLTNVGKEGSDPTAVLRLVGSSDILSDPSILINPDILNSGIISETGFYEASPVLNIGYVADCYVNLTWRTAGIPVGTNILADTDILNNPDILSSRTGDLVDVWLEIATASSSSGDMFQPPDLFGPDVPDMFSAGTNFGAWQRYVPGVYRAQFLKYRAAFTTLDPAIIAYLETFVSQVSIPARIDHYIGNNVTIAGLTIIFEPDDAITASPFNGGPLVGGTSNHPLPAVSMDWQGSPTANYIIDAISLSQMTFHFVDGTGATVAVNGVDVVVEGY